MSALRRLDTENAHWQPEQASEDPRPEHEPLMPEEWEQSAEPRCPECDGVGWFRPRLPLDHPDARKLIPCRCTQAKLTRKRIAQLRALSHLEAFHDKTFATFNQFAPGLQVAYQRAQAFVQQPNSWLTLLGPCGCGKTHLAAAIAHAALNAETPALFVVVPDLLDHLRTTYSPTSETSYDKLFDTVRSEILEQDAAFGELVVGEVRDALVRGSALLRPAQKENGQECVYEEEIFDRVKALFAAVVPALVLLVD